MSNRSAPSARLTLLTGPPGSGKSQVALERIREAATVAGARGRAAGSATAALLVLPTYGEAQHALRSALHRWDARGLWDAPFVTFTSAGERFLPGFQVRSLPTPEERDRLMERALEEADVPAFRGVRAHRGFRARLLKLLKDVKQGTRPAAEAMTLLAERAPRLTAGPRERLEGFLVVAVRYADLLARAGLEDHEDALHRLHAALEAGPPPAPPGLLVVDGFDDMSPVEEAILFLLVRHVGAAGGEVLVTLPFEETRAGLFASAAGLRARLLGRGFVEQRLTGFVRRPGGALEQIARGYGGTPPPRPTPAGDELCLLEALDADDEDERVAREVRALLEAAGRPGALVRGARDILLVVPDLAGRGPGLARALERLGVPTHVDGPQPLEAEAWVRAAAAPLHLLAGEVEAGALEPERVLDTLRYRRAQGDGACGDAGLDLATLDRQEMRWRREGFPGTWAALLEDADAPLRALLADFERERVRLLPPAPPELLMEALDRLVPLPAPAGLDPDGRSRDPAHDRALARAIEARGRVASLVQERAAAAARVGARVDARETARDLLEALERAAFVPRERRLEVIHLLDSDAARGWEAEVVFVVGLEEHSLPRRAQEDPLLADREREMLAEGELALPTSLDREAREQRRVLAVLTRARRRLVLSRPTLSPEGDPLPGARVLDDLAKLVSLVPQPGPARVGPGAPALDACLTRADLLHHAAVCLGRGLRAVAQPLLSRLDPGLAARAARWRRTVADALAPDALARFVGSVEVVSASRLKDALTCAQRHFLLKVVGLEGEDAPLAGPAFGALELGTAMHAAFEIAVRTPDRTAEDIATQALARAGLEGLEREVTLAEVARGVRLFRQREALLGPTFRPSLEWLERELASPAIELGPPGERFRLQGKVDRVDLAEDGKRALVIDYKLGSGRPQELQQATLLGADLQLPLYARALETAHGLEVLGLEWVGALARRRRVITSDVAPDEVAERAEDAKAKVLPQAAFRALLEGAERRAADVIARVRTGDHGLEPLDATDCASCAVRTACRPDPRAVERAAERRASLATVEEDA